jgi:hypothetical protein
MQRLKIALPDELRARLDAASAKSGQSVAEEIRNRVEASFAREAADQPTADFLEGMGRAAAEIEREVGAAWRKNAFAHEVLKQVILLRLELLKPEAPSILGDRPHATIDDDDPSRLASMIEFRLRRDPHFTTSETRKLLEEEHRMKQARGFMAQAIARGQKVPPGLLNQPPDRQQKLDQPKKRGK